MKKILSVFSLLMLLSVFGISNLAFAADTPPSFPDPFAGTVDNDPPVPETKDATPPNPEIKDPATSTVTNTSVSGSSSSSSSSGSGGSAILLNKKTTKPVITDQNNDGIVDTTDEEIYYANNPQDIPETGPEVAYILLASMLGSFGIGKIGKLKKK